MMNSTYKVFTPAGQFDAVFAEDEDIPIEYSGDELAISFFKDWLFINQVSGEHGHLLDSRNLTPRDLYGFCQPRGGVIEVMPPFEDLLAYIQEDGANPVEDNDEQPQEENTMQKTITNDSAITDDVVKNIGDATLDSISGIEKIKLIKEAGSIRSNLQTVQSGMEKLKMVKRVGEIRSLLGVKENKSDGGSTSVVIAIFKDEEDNIEVRVAKIASGYSVTLKDLDSDEVLPSAMIYPDEETAIQKAKEIAKVDQKVIPEPKNEPFTITDVEKNLPILKRFIGDAQLSVMMSSARGEEGQFFIDKMLEVANTISTMPKTYGQDGMGDKAIAYLHYFKGSGDWHITERDMEDEQLQAFGLANLGYGGELGYISIQELIDAGVELDLYWTPKTLREVKGLPDKEKDDPNIGREWNAIWGRQKIVGIFGGDLYEVKTIEDGSVRRYRMSEIERIITGDEYKLTPEYAKEAEDRKEENRLREERDKAAAEASAKTDAEIAEFTRSRGMSPPNAENARQALIAQVRYNGDQIMSRKKMIESLVSDGRIVEFTKGERRLAIPGGDTFMSENSTTKIGMDYAEYLIAKGNDQPQKSVSSDDTAKSGFIAELEALKTETDINLFNERLDEIAARIEQVGLMESLDKELNDAADVLTRLLSEAEKAG